MRILAYPTPVITLSFVLIAFAGCESQQSANDQPPAAGGALNRDHGDEHEGPHDGRVIDLGRSHEYHAEIVEDNEHQLVTVYILGGDIKELPIDANKLTMSLIVEDEPRSFELLATSAVGEKASRFDAADPGLFEALHEHEASGKLSVTINGTPYVGDVKHHDHGHGHDNERGHDDDDHAHGDGHDH